MKAKPFKRVGNEYHPCIPQEATHIRMKLPCPCCNLMLPVMIGGTRAGTGNWTWNGDTEKPTVKPSVLTRGHNFTCHSFINDGIMQFLSDTTSTDLENPDTHKTLGGKSLPLPDIEAD